MRYLIVFAHPEPRSLNAAPKDHAATALVDHGHEVHDSDLYAMRLKAVADAEDFPLRETASRLIKHQARPMDQAHRLADDLYVLVAPVKLLRLARLEQQRDERRHSPITLAPGSLR